MTYQRIRGYLESITQTALNSAGIQKVFFDNVAHSQPDAAESYAEISISFTTIKVDTIGACAGNDNVNGSVYVFIRTPANVGSVLGEEASLSVFGEWCNSADVSLRSFDGPRTISNDDESVHQLYSISAAFFGKLD